MLSVYGSENKEVNLEKYQEHKENLPTDFQEFSKFFVYQAIRSKWTGYNSYRVVRIGRGAKKEENSKL